MARRSKIKVTRDGHILYFYNPQLKKKVRYDLVRNCMEKQNKDGKWEWVQSQYEFFRNFSLETLNCPEVKFRNMILQVKKLNPNCYSLSTFVARLSEALVYENYINEGIRAECRVRYGWGNRREKEVLKKPITFYSKNMIKFFKECDIEVTLRLEQKFICDYQKMEKLISILSCSDLNRDERKDIFEDIMYSFENFNELIDNFKYDILALCKYLIQYLEPFENIKPSEGLNLLKDYYYMSNIMGRDVKKYPKYLKSMHDIITANFNSYKAKYDEELFNKLRKVELDYEDKEYCIVTPQCSKDIIREGTSLNHCVSSYVNKILEGKTYIFFLRRTNYKDSPLVTLEFIGNKITQAKGSYNRPLEDKERNFLKQYCQVKNIKMEV